MSHAALTIPRMPPRTAKPVLSRTEIEVEPFDIEQLITEDDEPVDNIFSEKQQRLLTRSLYSSQDNIAITKPFLVAANVGIFGRGERHAIAPDVFLSLGVQVAEDWYAKRHRSYFVAEFGKAPDLVLEIVSNTKGNEANNKMYKYAKLDIPYYVIYDPQKLLSQDSLRAYSLHQRTYHRLKQTWFPNIGLGLQTWSGEFEHKTDEWLRWCDQHGNILLTGQEQAEQERLRVEQERIRAQSAEQRAQSAEAKAAKYLAQLKALGIEIED